ncbi:MAG: PD-(D/E)XK nuclease family protein [Oscillospiraceae bacterium]|nr:PD-(D/E)XK nuclease family protein [Oscillospiraceae bacterium]
MLRLLLGRSGTGKTHTIYQRLCDLAWSTDLQENEGLILLVPEQFSFESERTLLRRLGPVMAGRVRVLSFTRMAELVFREVGGLAGRRMDDATRTLLMSRALEITTDNLTLFRRAASDTGAVGTILSVTAEMKQCGISPLDLERTAADMEDGTLRRKMQELSVIMGAYEAVAAGVTDGGDDGMKYIDPTDDLTVLAAKLQDSSLAVGAHIFIDSFKGFTAPELAVLRVLFRQAKQITVALCADGTEDKAGGYGLFSPVIRTASRLKDMAWQDGVEVAKIELLTQNMRAATEGLKVAEASLFTPRPTVYDKPAGEVMIAPCSDIYDECDFVAREIRRRLRENGGRCRDFAVVARNLGEYRGVLDSAMEKQGIPFVMDERTDILTEPLITLALSALDVITGGFKTEDILRLIKTGLAGFSTHSAALIENYALMWRINGAGWRNEWKGNPNGLAVRADEQSGKQLSYLNLLRRRLVSPLERLHSAIYNNHASGEDFAKAVYRYIIEVKADVITRMRVARLDKAGEPALAERMARIWDVTMELLDRMAVVCRGASFSPTRLTDLLRTSAGLTDLGAVPQSLDAVQVGAADRIRFSSPKTVFILGANEGVFPAYPSDGGILTDNERNQLISRGLSLSDTADQRAVEERFFAYAAVAAPSDGLVVSYIKGNAAGESLSPSVLVESLKRILPECSIAHDRDERAAESEKDAFEYTALLWGSTTPRAAALKKVFSSRDEYIPRLNSLERAASRKPAAFNDPDTARLLFPSEMNLSASRIESYYRCRFAYFCKYGLKAEPRRTADLDGLTFGTLTHWVMEKVLPVYTAQGIEDIDRPRVFADVVEAVGQYVDDVMGGTEDKTSRFAALLKRLSAITGALLWQVVSELKQSRFVPVDFELSVGRPYEGDEPFISPVVLTLPDGSKVRVVGKIDRVDVYKQGSTSYVRVLDYKTGSKEFRLSDVVEGINVQMLIYLFSVWQNGRERYGDVVPAGILYMPAKLPVVQVGRDADMEKVKAEQIKALRMNGLLLDDPEVIRAMEKDAAGLFIPAKLNNNGEFSKGSGIASLEQMGLLKKSIDRLLIKMAQTLRQGDIAALPTAGEVEACDWCDYKTVCGHEQDDPVRFLQKRDDKMVFDELAKAEDN